MNGKEPNKGSLSKKVLSWHKLNGRHNLPWQKNINPYKVWISEIMLQQTQVSTVLPYFKLFIKKYPNIKSLTNAKLEDILELWTGLGYYKRAENIYKTAQILKENYQFKFPKNYEDIINLPGIGKSTAGAILSIAYKKKYPILDGNVKRVIKRLFAIQGNANNDSNLWALSESILPNKNNDIFSQAIMDVGSLVCTINNPSCSMCPLIKDCKSYKLKLTKIIPEKKKNNLIKKKKIYLLLIQDYKKDNFILMKKNNKEGLWANLWNLPSFSLKKELNNFVLKNKIKGKIKIFKNFSHNLTHYKLDILVFHIKLSNKLIIKNYNWKNIYDKIAISKPVLITFESLIKEIENANGNVR